MTVASVCQAARAPGARCRSQARKSSFEAPHHMEIVNADEVT
eukprot:CAMPEP_0204560744 /NCGR_PEP_ID=MMETSP0661-20131031/32793_1 /ASSEMBLY_ACC=CAM_ASM_000606 /TAXON_ID=109239 /ORGANISM="Alexandrium margalefi, Strain AMGDE01CS-322" /LENGTH=41 /DNA_ID= /DNA_START= /DNA_END= /DNA_ORIENTATION=